jgi:hypothetical protein
MKRVREVLYAGEATKNMLDAAKIGRQTANGHVIDSISLITEVSPAVRFCSTACARSPMTIRKAELAEKSVLSRLQHPKIVTAEHCFESRPRFAVGMKRELKRALQPDGNYAVIQREPEPGPRRHPV